MIESGQSSQTNPSSQYPRTDPSDLASNLPTKAHHPKAFKFPKRSFGKKTVVNQVFNQYDLKNGLGCTTLRMMTMYFVSHVRKLVHTRSFSGLPT